MFNARRLKSLTRKLLDSDGAVKERLWSEAIHLISAFVRQGLQRYRAQPDEADEALAEVLLRLCEGPDGIAGRLASLPTSEIGPYLRVAGGRALVRLRDRGGRLESLAWPAEVIMPLGRAPEPDEQQRALAALAVLDPETRFVLRALMLGYEIDEIHEALGGRSRSILYRRRDDGVKKLLTAMRAEDSARPRPPQ